MEVVTFFLGELWFSFIAFFVAADILSTFSLASPKVWREIKILHHAPGIGNFAVMLSFC